MFAIGTAEETVSGMKLRIPKEYNLNKKGRKIYGLWVGEDTLYLSDEMDPLRARAGRNGNIFEGGVNNTPKLWNPKTGLKKP